VLINDILKRRLTIHVWKVFERAASLFLLKKQLCVPRSSVVWWVIHIIIILYHVTEVSIMIIKMIIKFLLWKNGRLPMTTRGVAGPRNILGGRYLGLNWSRKMNKNVAEPSRAKHG
jgi:hypothetical protein